MLIMMKIVVNGCFDLFHDGHKHIISKALKWSNHGHILILLNSDASVQNLKGTERPIDSFDVRKKNIEDFKTIWCSINGEHPVSTIKEFSSEAQLEKLIDKFEPDMILKGNDRTDVRDIVGSTRWAVCILPRITNKDGNIISTTLLTREI
jgi:D-beta-D-heptose 7-phosphate kinase/D-beta-D-heptose 1-phosphate adenosyltransferase